MDVLKASKDLKVLSESSLMESSRPCKTFFYHVKHDFFPSGAVARKFDEAVMDVLKASKDLNFLKVLSESSPSPNFPIINQPSGPSTHLVPSNRSQQGPPLLRLAAKSGSVPPREVTSRKVVIGITCFWLWQSRRGRMHRGNTSSFMLTALAKGGMVLLGRGVCCQL
jgi:hypothetical protein